jgi:hypothetical protein
MARVSSTCKAMDPLRAQAMSSVSGKALRFFTEPKNVCIAK